MSNHNFAILACGDVGRTEVEIFKDDPESLKCVVIHSENYWKKNDDIIRTAKEVNNDIPVFYEDKVSDAEYFKSLNLDVIILGFWNKLITAPLINIPKVGILNAHTSLLPYSKGKHPHIWSIVEQNRYGVTIQLIDDTLDTGDIVFQKEIPYTWQDTGESLFFTGIKELCNLITEHKDDILNLRLPRKKQIPGSGTFHYGKELETLAHIDLDQKYSARELLNILRAKTFPPFPAAYFEEDGVRYEALVKIQKAREYRPEELNYREIEESYLKKAEEYQNGNKKDF